MQSVKEEVQAMVSTLPELVSYEDVQYELYVLAKIRRGQETAKQKGSISQEEMERQLEKWTIK